ncbi:hypothetical protein AVEN_97472-1, partial [Araneus ventricosus]
AIKGVENRPELVWCVSDGWISNLTHYPSLHLYCRIINEVENRPELVWCVKDGWIFKMVYLSITPFGLSGSELLLGKILKNSGWKRSSYIVATKLVWGTNFLVAAVLVCTSDFLPTDSHIIPAIFSHEHEINMAGLLQAEQSMSSRKWKHQL